MLVAVFFRLIKGLGLVRDALIEGAAHAHKTSIEGAE